MKRHLLVTAAILLPLLPLSAWLVSSWREFGEPLGWPFFVLYVPARALALVGFVLMFYQFILASRIGFVETILPRAKQLKTHRTLGKIGGVMMLTHGLFMLAFDWISLGAIAWTFGKLLGVIGLFLIVNAVIAAWFIRPLQLKQPTWRRIHRAAYVAFPLIFLHGIFIGSTVSGYLAVRILFAVFFGIYLILLVRRIFFNPMATKPPQKKPAGAGKKPAATVPHPVAEPPKPTDEAAPAKDAGGSSPATEGDKQDS